jgi:hypothetical protein
MATMECEPLPLHEVFRKLLCHAPLIYRIAYPPGGDGRFNTSELQVLVVLHEYGAQTHRKLQWWLEVDASRISKALSKLRETDMVRESVDAGNPRVRVAALTSTGMQTAEEYVKGWYEEWVEAFFGAFGVYPSYDALPPYTPSGETPKQ